MGKGFMEKYCDPKWLADMATVSKRRWFVFWILALIFAVLGIIADAMNGTLGLTAMSWFMLTIAFFVASLSFCLAWAMGVYFRALEAKKAE